MTTVGLVLERKLRTMQFKLGELCRLPDAPRLDALSEQVQQIASAIASGELTDSDALNSIDAVCMQIDEYHTALASECVGIRPELPLLES